MECRQISHKKKKEQLESTYDTIALMLKREGYLAYKNGIILDTDEEVKHFINHNIDVRKYFNVEYGEHIACIRPSCNNAYGANFFKGENGATLYTCVMDCLYRDETVPLITVVIDLVRYNHKLLKESNYYDVMYKIKLMVSPGYESEFYKEFKELVEHNRAVIEGLNSKKYLKQIFVKRNLMECYMDFTEIALIYMKQDEEIPYTFYCSNKTVRHVLKHVLEKESTSSYQIDKINILVALGLIEKLDEDECSKRMRAKLIKAKIAMSEGKNFSYNTTTAYRMRRLTMEDIEEAERKAKILIQNKVYKVKKDTFKEIERQNKKDARKNEAFIKRAKQAVKEELKKKDYIQLHKLVSKIDPKYKIYSTKQEKEELLDFNIKRIMSDCKLEIILVNDSARKQLKLTRSVKDNTELLIRKNTELNNKKKSSKNDGVYDEVIETSSSGKTFVLGIDSDICVDDVPFE